MDSAAWLNASPSEPYLRLPLEILAGVYIIFDEIFGNIS